MTIVKEQDFIFDNIQYNKYCIGKTKVGFLQNLTTGYVYEIKIKLAPDIKHFVDIFIDENAPCYSGYPQKIEISFQKDVCIRDNNTLCNFSDKLNHINELVKLIFSIFEQESHKQIRMKYLDDSLNQVVALQNEIMLELAKKNEKM